MTATCPHCNQEFQAQNAAKHAFYCVYRDGIRELVRRLAESPDEPGVIGSKSHYEAAANYYNRTLNGPANMRAPALSTLRERLGNWDVVAKWCGLMTSESLFEKWDSEPRHRVADVLREERERTVGLAVSRVREIDGGRRVAYELR